MAHDDENESAGPCLTCGMQCSDEGICPCCAQAEKIDDALAAFDENDAETQLVDLLTAAMHFARRDGVAFDVAVAIARGHFNAERIAQDAPMSDADIEAIRAARLDVVECEVLGCDRVATWETGGGAAAQFLFCDVHRAEADAESMKLGGPCATWSAVRS